MMDLLKRKPLLSGILYEVLLHVIFWGPIVLSMYSSNRNIVLLGVLLIPFPVWLSLAFPFIHRKMLVAGKGSLFALGTLISGIVMNLTEIFLELNFHLLLPLDLAGLIFYYIWIILLGISILKWIIAGIQSLVYAWRSHHTPSAVSDASTNFIKEVLS